MGNPQPSPNKKALSFVGMQFRDLTLVGKEEKEEKKREGERKKEGSLFIITHVYFYHFVAWLATNASRIMWTFVVFYTLKHPATISCFG